jgi:MFS family permease
MTPLRRVAGRTFSSAFTSRNLRLYFAGSSVSQVGTWIQLVALPWLVLHITHSGAMLGLTYALQFFPILVFGAWAGVIADRHDKRKLMMVTTTAQGVLAFVLGIFVLADIVNLGIIVVLALLMGTANAFDNPARRSFVPELVEHGEVTNAVSLSNAVFTSARIVGPSIAGILIASVGIGWCFVINAFSFAGVIVALLLMQTSEIRAAVPIKRERGQLIAGIRYAWDEPLVRLAIIMTIVVGVLTFNYQVVLPLLAKRTFDGGAGSYALMFAATGVGSLFGALASAHRARASGRLMALSSIALGITMGLAAIAPTLLIEYIVLVPMGAAGMMFFSMANAAVQERADGPMLGRVTALFSVAFLGSTPIGSPLIGAIAQMFGARVALAIGAVSALVTGLLALLALRHWLGRARARREPPTEVLGSVGAAAA